MGEVQPFSYQRAMAVAWPRVLVAPTGSGKTAAVTLAWAARRLTAPHETPRRLIWCLPMRTLVEQTAEAVKKWFQRLANAGGNDEGRLPGPADVFELMGGVDSRDWMDRPERPSVLVGTQDMLLSRALMRGYASSRALWPMEFGLLHEDAQWVFDEVQLMGAARATTAQLEAFRQAEANRAPANGTRPGRVSRSLWISATLQPQWLATVDHPAPPPESVVRVDPREEGDERLERLAHATKTLTRARAEPASAKKADLNAYVEELAAEVIEAHQARTHATACADAWRSGGLTLAILNRVDRAQALHGAIGKKLEGKAGTPPTLSLVHSRFRPADRQRETEKLRENANPSGRIVVATQAVEAGVDVSAAVLFTELAPWSSMVQRFGRANRYAEVEAGADVRWVDLLNTVVEEAGSERTADSLALPYEARELRDARARLTELRDVAPAHLLPADDVAPALRVIRRKDLDDLFDTDPDLTGFDVDVSPYVRDADDTDIRVFWRDLPFEGDEPPRPGREELCAVPIGAARAWIKSLRGKGKPLLYARDPQWRRGKGRRNGVPAGWAPFRDEVWPGLVLLADSQAGGYREAVGFTGNPKHVPAQVAEPAVAASGDQPAEAAARESEGHDEDPLSSADAVVSVADHTGHVVDEAGELCGRLGVDAEARSAILRAAHWHDVGKAHEVFQDTMRRGLGDRESEPGVLLAKTVGAVRHRRRYFRHELASALAFLAHEGWSRDADLAAYLIAAHHGKVRLNLRSLPRESPPGDPERAGGRFARGVWEGDELPALDLGRSERWEGGRLSLSIMELGWDELSRESWTERTRDLLTRHGPFRLAWMETILRLADWRASAREREGHRR